MLGTRVLSASKMGQLADHPKLTALEKMVHCGTCGSVKAVNRETGKGLVAKPAILGTQERHLTGGDIS